MSHTNVIGGKCPLKTMRVATPKVSWHMIKAVPTGSRVYDVHDERHVGRVDAMLEGGHIYRVTFDNGTRADIPKHRVRKAAKGD